MMTLSRCIMCIYVLLFIQIISSQSSSPLQTNTESIDTSKSLSYVESHLASGKQIIIPTQDRSINPVIPVCHDCHDTNAYIRDSLSTKLPPSKKFSLTLTLRDVEETIALENSLRAVDHMDGSLYARVVIFLLILTGIISIIFFIKEMIWNEKKDHKTVVPEASEVVSNGRSSSEPENSLPGVTLSDTVAAEFIPVTATSTIPLNATSYQVHEFHENPMLSTGITLHNSDFDNHSESQYDAKSESSSHMSYDLRSDKSTPINSDFLHSAFYRSLRAYQSSYPSQTPSLDSFSDSSGIVTPDTRRYRKYEKISDSIIKHTKKFSSKEEYKNDLAFILFVCNVVETKLDRYSNTKSVVSTNKDKDSINKKQLVIDTLTKMFTYSDEEIAALQKNIDYLHSVGLIKKDPYVDKFQVIRKRKT